MQNLLKTKDGSFSLYSEKYKDFYHSTKDGAILETLYKHIIPAFSINAESALDSTSALLQNPIKILDICFGLGYNALFSLAFARRLGISVEIHSVELNLLQSLRTFAYPKILQFYLPLDEILEGVFGCGAWHSGNLALFLHKGDAKDYLKALVEQSQIFDIIYQDAFSPTKNAELWSEEHFCKLFSLLHSKGVVSTYSSSKKVREICRKCGFEVYSMQSGNLKNGSIFCKNLNEQAKSLSFESITLTHLLKT